MSMPVGPGWYDDPDDAKAERWWDGQDWGPNRRRKHVSSSAPPPQSTPVTYFPSAPPPDPLPYPDPSASYPAYSPDVSNFGGSPPNAPPTAPTTSVSGFGVVEVISLLLALSGLALIASAFGTWGRVSDFVHIEGSDVTVTVEYPGMGDPTPKGRFPQGGFQFFPETALHNTNPGWLALALGVVVIAAGVAFYLAWNRKIVAVVTAVLSTVSLVVCISQFIDLRGTFDDPTVLLGAEFSPGLGLIATTALSIFVAIAASFAFVNEQRTADAAAFSQ